MAGVREGEFTALCTSHPAVRQWMGDALAHVFRQVPDLAGVFTITASENLTNCASHGDWQSLPALQESQRRRIIAEVNAVIEEGVHRGNPKAKVIVWDWGWRGHGDAPDIIARLPKSVWLMSVSEWDLPIDRGGVQDIGRRILAFPPSDRARGRRATGRPAKEAGLKTVAKVQLNNTWELSTVPYLPVMDLVAEHCHNLASAGVDGMMLSWTLGGYPSPNLEIAARFRVEADPQRRRSARCAGRRALWGRGRSAGAKGLDRLQHGVPPISVSTAACSTTARCRWARRIRSISRRPAIRRRWWGFPTTI